ncbi:hypothetical protein L1887_05257 [Cichorium endivia]|nr:hypothetical protein L1887_05257 [Cichorium endivia]
MQVMSEVCNVFWFSHISSRRNQRQQFLSYLSITKHQVPTTPKSLKWCHHIFQPHQNHLTYLQKPSRPEAINILYLRWGATLMNSFMFDVVLILLCSDSKCWKLLLMDKESTIKAPVSCSLCMLDQFKVEYEQVFEDIHEEMNRDMYVNNVNKRMSFSKSNSMF